MLRLPAEQVCFALSHVIFYLFASEGNDLDIASLLVHLVQFRAAEARPRRASRLIHGLVSRCEVLHFTQRRDLIHLDVSYKYAVPPAWSCCQVAMLGSVVQQSSAYRARIPQ